MVSLGLRAVKCCDRVVGVLDPKHPPSSRVSVRGARQWVRDPAYVTYDVGGEDAVKYDRQFREHSTQYALAKNVFQYDHFVNGMVWIRTPFHPLQKMPRAVTERIVHTELVPNEKKWRRWSSVLGSAERSATAPRAYAWERSCRVYAMHGCDTLRPVCTTRPVPFLRRSCIA